MDCVKPAADVSDSGASDNGSAISHLPESTRQCMRTDGTLHPDDSTPQHAVLEISGRLDEGSVLMTAASTAISGTDSCFVGAHNLIPQEVGYDASSIPADVASRNIEGVHGTNVVSGGEGRSPCAEKHTRAHAVPSENGPTHDTLRRGDEISPTSNEPVFTVNSLRRHRQNASLVEWATAAQEIGRVCPPCDYGEGTDDTSDSPSDAASMATMPSNTSGHQCSWQEMASNFPINRGCSPHNVAEIRANARKFLLAGDLVTTFTLCESILSLNPSDSVALLYQGAAFAKRGEWTLAGKNMERVLALSFGADNYGEEDEERSRQSWNHRGAAKEQRASLGRSRISPDTTLAAVVNLASFARLNASKTRDPSAETFFLLEGIRIGGSHRDLGKYVGGEQADMMHAAASSDDGLIDILFMTARDFEEQGQLTAALRLYQRVVLLGGHQQKRILQGFGKVSQRLKQLQHSRRDVTSFPRPPPVVFSPAHADAPSARGAASSPAEIAHNHCEWSIIRPTSYQVFSPEAVIHVEFDLARLDPGVPIIGSLFASTRAHDVPGTTASVAATGVGFFVCSYLDRFQLPNCLPRAELRDLKLGWHVLTAEVFVLPSLEPLLCGHGGHSAADSVRTTRFCVGDDKICRQKRTDQVFHAAKGHNQPPQQPLNVVRTTTIPTQAAAGAEGEPPREGHQGPDPSTTGETATGEVELPFCFLTLALNALPFLTHHISVFREAGSKLSLRASFAAGGGPTEAGLSVNATDSTGYIPTPPESFWEWHIVEGVAVGRADHRSPYDHKPIPGRFYDSDTGLSIDGTTQYLNSIRDIGAEQVYIHRRCAEKTNGETAGGDVPETAIHGTSQRKGKSRGGGHACYTTTGEETSYFWRDKIEMVNAAVFSMERECLLVQIDSDELWTADQLIEIRDMFLQEREQAAIARGNITGLNNKSAENNRDGRPNDARTSETSEQGDASDGEEQRRSAPTRKARECAYFDCHFFVGPNLVTVTEDGWGHSTSSEWLRAWIFRPSESLWLRHAPPELARHGEASGWRLLVGDACVSREETRQRGLVFTHYAYALEKQVQFKSEFYGHSAQRSSLKGVESVADANAVVSEWKALQDIEPPVVLAEHLTWLRYQGHHQEPRLLTTVADRPRPKSRVPLHGDGHRGYADARGQSVEGQATQSDEVAVIPLEPFLGEIDAWTAEDVLRDVDSIGAESGGQSKGSTSSCQHESMGRGSCEHDRRLRVSGGRLNGGEGSRETLAGTVSCDSLHLVVDGAIFQADVGMLKGIARVWTNLIPTILSRLHGFEGTCLTLLIRGLAPPPSFLIKAFEGLPPERYSWTHIPPYNPSFGFLSDQLLLSGIVRRIAVQKGNGVSDYEKTAFISTMYTQPFWATTPGVLRVVLIHDLIPEIFEWDKSEGVWLTAHKADTATSASAVVAVSQHTAREFLRIYPRSSERAARLSTDTRPVWAAHNGVDTTMFYPVGRSKIDAFRNIASLDSGTPYVLIVGSRLGYKNAGTVYRAMTAANTPDARTTIALVLIGGGPVTPEELDALDGVRHWTHIGFGSVEEVASKTTVSAVVDDDLLAAAYSGAVALIQMSIGEGFGLTVLEAFACGCPVVASDIPPFREIAGLPERQQQHFVHELRKDTSTAAEARKAEGNPMGSTRSTNSSKEWARSLEGSRASTNERYGGAASSLGGGLILVDNPVSATQVWRALRALRALDNDRRDQISELLVKRAGHFDSWQPLADMLVKAAVRVK